MDGIAVAPQSPTDSNLTPDLIFGKTWLGYQKGTKWSQVPPGVTLWRGHTITCAAFLRKPRRLNFIPRNSGANRNLSTRSKQCDHILQGSRRHRGKWKAEGQFQLTGDKRRRRLSAMPDPGLDSGLLKEVSRKDNIGTVGKIWIYVLS